ncbi:short-chain dehydrogenase [Hypericibacter adhaerens]|uniref:Short-chain dehydrogenase n=1 Tax=Hypericibacter adhaerens TaxID=2602016 RepID=A0A5J6MXI3_9PROT|nr:SDR family NAD(P)-dependent oxidoreductase [Hypericibacter adhaerens]QEX22239.1 short-chain dehydrogenase [Hypericibacter adhaerens]
MAGVADRTALVTGAGSADGIGFAVARLLRAAGARVAITSTTKRIFERLEELPGGPKDKAAFVCDLTDRRAAVEMAKQAEKALGPLAILVNNAGMAQTGVRQKRQWAHEIDDESWDRQIDISVNTCFTMTRAVLPGMARRRYGRIVNMSSVTGPVVAIPRSTAYGTAKAAMLGFTRQVAIEYARKGITVNAIGPGWIATGSSSKAEIVAGNHTPAGRPGRADEVGHVCVFLASEEASYVTGQMIVVDGGNTIQEYKDAIERYY